MKLKVAYDVVENAFHSIMPEASETVKWSPWNIATSTEKHTLMAVTNMHGRQPIACVIDLGHN